MPPFTGVAVKTTLLPEQILLDVVEMLTDGVTFCTTVILSLFDVALFGEAQADADVTIQDTVSPLASKNVVKVLLLVPALVPFTFH